MKTALHRLPAMLLAAVTAVTAYTVSATNDWDQQADERKADMIFLEAQSAYAQGDFDQYVSLIERAYDLNSRDLDIAGERALVALVNQNLDSADAELAYCDLKKRYFTRPDNYITGAILANIATQNHRFNDAVRIWQTLDSIYPKNSEPAQELALTYLRSYLNGNDSTAYDKALAIYQDMQRRSGRSIELSNMLIRAYSIKNDTTAMIAELDSLNAEMPNDSYAAFFIGVNYEHLDMPQRAIQYYDRVCQLDSTNGTAYLARARFYMSQGDSIGFDREVFHALKSQNLDVDSKVEILRTYVADLYTDPTQEQRIRELFNTLQQMHMGESAIHNLYGAYLFEIGQYAESAEQFSFAVDLEPMNEECWQSYIQTSGIAGDTTAVLTRGSEAMKRFPTNLYFPMVVSSVHNMQGDHQSAIAVLDSVDLSKIKNDRGISTLIATKGDIYASMGDTLMALTEYDKALEYNPDNKMALNNAAYFITLSGGDLDKAERYSARSIQGDELNPTYLDTYAWVFFNKKDYKMAKYYIDIALNSYKTNMVEVADSAAMVDVPVAEGMDSLTMPEATPTTDVNSTDVIEVSDTAIDENVDDLNLPSAEIYDHAGDIYFMNGEKDQAVKYWEQAHELDPDDPIITKKVKNKTIFFRQ